ncbi:MAG TPA: fumarylacetoacetate hydrolase family protein, partial [Pseudomonadales bacterium]|nr:fumarylacetoacetate hydrolase family protein [Pseudomonadales bacterium]
KILAIALNYAEHVAESATTKPAVQMWFNKQSTCANGPFDPIDLPVASDKLDYEGELAVIIGKRCRHVPKERAHEVIFGYAIINDVSVRDWQRAAQTFQIGKSFDTHGPFGPYIVTPDEIEDAGNLNIRTLVNGEVRQDSNTKHMIYKIDEQIAHLTTAFTLEAGDVLATGTPSGVGAAMDPPNFLKAGDVVRIEIEKLGAIENPIVKEKGDTVIG